MGTVPRLRRLAGHRAGVAAGGAALLVLAVATAPLWSGASAPARSTAQHPPSAASRSRATPATDTAGQPLNPSLFSPGSCVAFPPTDGDRHQTVFVDAGHGGVDPGAVGTTTSGQTVYEADETLPVELDVMHILVAHGYRVVVSRTRASTVMRLTPGDLNGGLLTAQAAHDEVAARDQCADLGHADILLGIYFDAGYSDDDAGSVTAWDDARPFAADNERLANLVQFEVLSQLNAHGWQIPDDGVQTDGGLGGPPLTTGGATYGHLLLLGPPEPGFLSTPSEMPGALIEPLFITDPFEATIAASTVGQEAIAEGMATAAELYLDPPAPHRRGG